MAFNIIQSPILLQATALGLGSALCTGVFNRMLGSKTDKASKVYAKFALTTAAVDYFIVKGVELAGKVFTLPRATILLAILAGNCAYVAYAFGLLSKCFSGKSKPNEQNRTESPKKENTPPKTDQGPQGPKVTPSAQKPINLANNANVNSNNTLTKTIGICINRILIKEGEIEKEFATNCITAFNKVFESFKSDVRFKVVDPSQAKVRIVFTSIDSRIQPIEIAKKLKAFQDLSKKPYTILIGTVSTDDLSPSLAESNMDLKEIRLYTNLIGFVEKANRFLDKTAATRISQNNMIVVIRKYVHMWLQTSFFNNDKLYG